MLYIIKKLLFICLLCFLRVQCQETSLMDLVLNPPTSIEERIEAFKKGIEQETNEHVKNMARQQLAQIYIDQGNYNEARPVLKVMIQWADENKERGSLGWPVHEYARITDPAIISAQEKQRVDELYEGLNPGAQPPWGQVLMGPTTVQPAAITEAEASPIKKIEAESTAEELQEELQEAEQVCQEQEVVDYYEIFGADRTVTQQELHNRLREFRNMYDEADPDRLRMYVDIFQVLAHPDRRRLYDIIGPEFYNNLAEAGDETVNVFVELAKTNEQNVWHGLTNYYTALAPVTAERTPQQEAFYQTLTEDQQRLYDMLGHSRYQDIARNPEQLNSFVNQAREQNQAQIQQAYARYQAQQERRPVERTPEQEAFYQGLTDTQKALYDIFGHEGYQELATQNPEELNRLTNIIQQDTVQGPRTVRQENINRQRCRREAEQVVQQKQEERTRARERRERERAEAFPTVPLARPGKAAENIIKAINKLESALRKLKATSRYMKDLDKQQKENVKKRVKNALDEHKPGLRIFADNIKQIEADRRFKPDLNKFEPLKKYAQLVDQIYAEADKL